MTTTNHAHPGQALRVILVRPRGFCAGVNRAIEILAKVLERFGPPVYVYHEIVHNKHVVESFRQRGVIFVDKLADVPQGSLVVFSAHGVSPAIREEASRRHLRVIDATCPLVTKVHREAAEFAKRGYTIVLIGHAGHDEVVGTMGEAPGQVVLVEKCEHVARLQLDNPDRVAYLMQTTLSLDDAQQIVAALKEKFPAIVGPAREDICYATQNRQRAIRTLAREADLALVVGSPNSSNSRRLVEIAQKEGIPAYLIDDTGDIDIGWFAGRRTVLLSAGASAPEYVVQDVCRYLQEQFDATVEERTVFEESVHFPLPPELR